MPEIVVSGAGSYDGRYPMIPLNRYEQGQIRRLTGFMPTEIWGALEGGDAELLVAVTVLAMERAGRIQEADVKATFRRLLRMDDADIESEADPDEPEADAGPPPESSNLSSDSFTPGSSRNSETSETTRPANGIPGSDISVFTPDRLET